MGIFDIFKKPPPAPAPAPKPAPAAPKVYAPTQAEVMAGKDALRKAVAPYVAAYMITDQMYEDVAYKVVLAAGKARGG
jgi:hypothetical protein